MTYLVVSGEVTPGGLYVVSGSQSVTYNSITYITDEKFRGVGGIKTFMYSGTGTQAVYEIQEITGGGIEYMGTSVDRSGYPEATLILGVAVEFDLTEAEKIVNEVTNINGFSIELIDYPFYSFEITEIRL
ncbi:MAG: hypothetical protein V4456_02820 [Bacteroidota bacterium]